MQTVDQDIRDIAQEKAVENWENNRNRGSIIAGVGFGKSYVGIKCMNKYPGKWLIVCPTDSIIKNWHEELEKFNIDSTDIEFICYASLHKTNLIVYDGIILDEVHRVTPLNTSTFDTAVSPLAAIVGLTGTEPTEPEKVKFMQEYCPVVFRFTLNRAVDEGIVSDYRVVKIPIPLDDTTGYVKTGSKKKGYSYVTEKHKYDMFASQIRFARGQRRMMLYIERSQFLGTAKSKTFFAQDIIKMIRSTGEKFLIFCAKIDQAEELSPYTYHSKTTDENLEAFKRGDVQELAVVTAADEGLSIPGIQSALVLCYNSKDRRFVQRLGRALRRKDGLPAIIYCIYFKDTKDEEWFNNSTESLDEEKFLSF